MPFHSKIIIKYIYKKKCVNLFMKKCFYLFVGDKFLSYCKLFLCLSLLDYMCV